MLMVWNLKINKKNKQIQAYAINIANRIFFLHKQINQWLVIFLQSLLMSYQQNQVILLMIKYQQKKFKKIKWLEDEE